MSLWQPIRRYEPGSEIPTELGVYFDEATVSRIDRASKIGWLIGSCTAALVVGVLVWQWWNPTHTHDATIRHDATPPPLSIQERKAHAKEVVLHAMEVRKDAKPKVQ